MSPQAAGATETRSGAGGRGRVLILAGILAGAALAVALGGGDGPADPGEAVAGLALEAVDVAAALQIDPSAVRRTGLPFDLGVLESAARHLPSAERVLPADRSVTAYSAGPGGGRVVQAVLFYDSPAAADQALAGAEELLGMGFGLVAAESAGPSDWRYWSGSGYVGVSLRRGAYVVFVALEGADWPAAVALARAAEARLVAGLEGRPD